MIISFIQRAIMQGIPLLFGSTGEIITEKSGHLNLGIPGIMYVGGISGVIGAFLYEQSVQGPLNPVLAILIPLPAYGDPACQSECYRFGTDHLWRGLRQLLRRFPD